MSFGCHRSNIFHKLSNSKVFNHFSKIAILPVYRSRRASGLGGYDDADEWNENKEVGANIDDPHPQTQQYDDGKKYLCIFVILCEWDVCSNN